MAESALKCATGRCGIKCPWHALSLYLSLSRANDTCHYQHAWLLSYQRHWAHSLRHAHTDTLAHTRTKHAEITYTPCAAFECLLCCVSNLMWLQLAPRPATTPRLSDKNKSQPSQQPRPQFARGLHLNLYLFRSMQASAHFSHDFGAF